MTEEEKDPKENLTSNDAIITKISGFVNKEKISDNNYLFEIDDLIKKKYRKYFGEKNIENLTTILTNIKNIDLEKTIENTLEKPLIEKVILRLKFFIRLEIIRNDKSISKVKFKISSIPPQTAFKKVGNNKLKINPTGRDYGLLFK